MEKSIKRLAILGSTGSIGKQTLDIVRTLPDKFRIVGLAAGRNSVLLEEQVAEFKPKLVSYQHGSRAPSGKYNYLPVEEIAHHPEVDVVIIAISGYAGLSPTLAAVRAGKYIALANKESLVSAGEIINAEAKKSGAHIFPVDSEHSAVWQCIQGEGKQIERIILTASGGPFRHLSSELLEQVTPEQALRHPSWHMGKKVTIDSATLMNKGLEVIEAHWLFNVPYEKIRVIVHPQSIIHSMVEFKDGSIKAQLSCPDMRFPIQYALTYPERLANPKLPRLDWNTITNFDFEQPNFDTFCCLKLAIDSGKKGGSYPTVLCAADEVAVNYFLSNRIKFTDIASLIQETLTQHRFISHPTLDDIIAADSWARKKTSQLTSKSHSC